MSKNRQFIDNPPAYSAQSQQYVQPQVIARPVTTIIPVGPDPIIIYCPSCNANVQTEVEHKSSTKTHLMALILLLLFWPCTCVPYCIDSCQNANHYCPNCHSYIGTYNH